MTVDAVNGEQICGCSGWKTEDAVGFYDVAVAVFAGDAVAGVMLADVDVGEPLIGFLSSLLEHRPSLPYTTGAPVFTTGATVAGTRGVVIASGAPVIALGTLVCGKRRRTVYCFGC